MQQVADHAAQVLERHLNTGAPATRWCLRFATATGRAGICRYTARNHPTLGQLHAATARGRHPRHALAPDPARDRRARPRPRRRVADRRAAHRLHREPLRHRHAQPKAVDGAVPPASRPVVPSTPDCGVRQRSICPPCGSRSAWRINAHGEGRRPPQRASRLAKLLVRSDDRPMATGTAKRPPADPRRPAGGSLFRPTRPPCYDTPRGSLEQPEENTSAPAAAATANLPRHRRPLAITMDAARGRATRTVEFRRRRTHEDDRN